MLFVYTDEINTGKSTRLLEMLNRLISKKFKFNGWLTLPHFDNSKKIGHDFVSIVDSKISELVPFSRKSAFPSSVQVGSFFLNMHIFEEVVPSIPLKDNFIVDEVGALEMERYEGFYGFLNEIFIQTRRQIVVVQKRALDNFLDEFGRFKPQVFLQIDELESKFT